MPIMAESAEFQAFSPRSGESWPPTTNARRNVAIDGIVRDSIGNLRKYHPPKEGRDSKFFEMEERNSLR